jgi:hypothetical protein
MTATEPVAPPRLRWRTVEVTEVVSETPRVKSLILAGRDIVPASTSTCG